MMGMEIEDMDYENILTILEQADNACRNHDSEAGHLYIAILKMLMYALKDGNLKIVPAGGAA